MRFKTLQGPEQRNYSNNKSLYLRTSKESQEGFTLLEVMVAVVILGLSYVSILQSFSMSMSNIHKVRQVRGEIFEESIQLAQATKFTGTEVTEDEEFDGESLLFIEGHKYQLVTITSESGEMATLRLEKIQ